MFVKYWILTSLAWLATSTSQCGEYPSKISVPGGHTLHLEVHGNCSGRTLLYFHGGWGPLSHDLDIVPSSFRTVYFHQRGWDLSEPQGSIINNTFEDIIQDAELIKHILGVHERWVVFGGSNGATLALMYAARFSHSVAGVVMRGYWAMTPQHLSWDYLGTGKQTVWPEEWKRVCDAVRCSGTDLLDRYYGKLDGAAGDDGCSGESPPAACRIGCAWLRWDALGSAIAGVPSDVCKASGADSEWYQLHPAAASRLGVHFYRQAHVVPDLTALLSSGVGVHFVNGRFDMLCPPGFAADLVKVARKAGVVNWNQTIVEHAAHSGVDPGMTAVLQEALAGFDNLDSNSPYLMIET